jgi:hypothetical protein
LDNGFSDSFGPMAGQRWAVLDAVPASILFFAGKCSSMVNLELRSTKGPVAELCSPMMRSPSQCPELPGPRLPQDFR